MSNITINKFFVTAPLLLPNGQSVINDLPIAVIGFEKLDEAGQPTGEYKTVADWLAPQPWIKPIYLPSGNTEEPVTVEENPDNADTHFLLGFPFTPRGVGHFINFVEGIGIPVYDDESVITDSTKLTETAALFVMSITAQNVLKQYNPLYVVNSDETS